MLFCVSSFRIPEASTEIKMLDPTCVDIISNNVFFKVGQGSWRAGNNLKKQSHESHCHLGVTWLTHWVAWLCLLSAAETRVRPGAGSLLLLGPQEGRVPDPEPPKSPPPQTDPPDSMYLVVLCFGRRKSGAQRETAIVLC